MPSAFLLLLFATMLHFPERAAAQPVAGSRQLVCAVAPDWDSHRGVMRLFERSGRRWESASGFVPVLYGKNGLAWGRGLAAGSEPAIYKREGDRRAPAGAFAIGTVYSSDAALPGHSRMPHRRTGPRDAWIDDPAHPLYNQHIVIDDPANPPPWFGKGRMKIEDPVYRWLVEIRHNRDDIEPGAGSAIFFHIRRGADRPTHGCTTMAEEHLGRLIEWLDPAARPVYVLLPEAAYRTVWRQWDLPGPELAIPTRAN